ncbi:MAG: HEAT repeat domain-containing protein [bacterium]
MTIAEINELIKSMSIENASEALRAACRIRLFAKSLHGQGEPGDISGIVEYLCAALKSDIPAAASIAAEALGELGQLAADSVAALIVAMECNCAETRWSAAEALGKIAPQNEAAVVALTNALADENRTVRIAAAWSLKKLGSFAQAAVPELTKAAQSNDSMFQRRAIRALGRIGGCAVSALPILRTMLSDAERAEGRDGELLRHVLEIAIHELDETAD